MSVHDETWDKCPHCKNVIKTWHGNFHKNKHCLNFESWHEFNDKFPIDKPIEQKTEPMDCLFNIYRETKPTSPPPLGPIEYFPEMMTLERDFVLYDLRESIKAGLEYAQECLSRHDQELGRTSRKNESWAKTIERDIARMKHALERIKKYEGT